MRNIILEAIYLQILIVKNILFFSLSNKKSGINVGHMFNQTGKYLFIASIIIVSVIPFLLSFPLSPSLDLSMICLHFSAPSVSARARNSAARYLTDGRV